VGGTGGEVAREGANTLKKEKGDLELPKAKQVFPCTSIHKTFLNCTK
jgi:hypothetical protein